MRQRRERRGAGILAGLTLSGSGNYSLARESRSVSSPTRSVTVVASDPDHLRDQASSDVERQAGIDRSLVLDRYGIIVSFQHVGLSQRRYHESAVASNADLVRCLYGYGMQWTCERPSAGGANPDVGLRATIWRRGRRLYYHPDWFQHSHEDDGNFSIVSFRVFDSAVLAACAVHRNRNLASVAPWSPGKGVAGIFFILFGALFLMGAMNPWGFGSRNGLDLPS